MELKDRHVVVTGGSRGTGAAIGAAFAAAGAQVTLVARSEKELASVAEGCGATYVAADLLQLDGLPELVERVEAIAPVDILVNNAGLGTSGLFDDLTAAQVRDLFTLNALVPAELTRLVLPALRQRGNGRLVFVASLSSQVALPGLTAYSTTKAAISMFAESLRRDLRGSGIGITTAYPGPIETGLYDDAISYPPCRDAFSRMLRLKLISKLSPEDVADKIVRACQKEQRRVVLPRRAGGQVFFSHLPQWIANPML